MLILTVGVARIKQDKTKRGVHRLHLCSHTPTQSSEVPWRGSQSARPAGRRTDLSDVPFLDPAFHHSIEESEWVLKRVNAIKELDARGLGLKGTHAGPRDNSE